MKNSLLENSTSADFLKVNNFPRNGDAGGLEEDIDVVLPPKELAEEWIGARLRLILEEGQINTSLVEAAAWATLRVLQTVAMGPLRASAAPRVAEAFLRVLLVGQVRQNKTNRPTN